MNRYLTEPQQHALLKAAKSNSDPLAQRDYHWMRLLIALGARIQEFSSLTRPQCEAALATGWLVVHKGQRKGGKRGHEYPVTETVRQCLVALLFIQRTESHRPIDGGHAEPLIWGREGEPLSVRSYQARLKLWVVEAGLDRRISVHWLRHSCGMNIIRRSRGKNPLKVVQLQLGHESLSSTGIYTGMSREELAAEMQQVDGARMSKRDAVRQAQGASA